jgi:zinc protease
VKTDHTSPTVSVIGSVKHNGDLQTPAGEEGISRILGDLFSYGTQTLDRLAFQKALDDIAANESAGYEFSVKVLKDHFSRGVQLLADNELHPALPAHAFAVVKQQTSQFIAGNLKSPGYRTSRALDLALLPAVITKWFGEWNATGPKPNTTLPAVPPNKPSSVNVADQEAVQDTVTLAEQLALNRFDPDYYPLQLGNHVLGGGFYATRLYHDLRQVSGYVYFVDVSLGASETRASYSVTYGCNPENVSKARALIQRDLEQMRTADVSPDELHQAKALLLRQIPLSESSEDAVAEGLLRRADIGLPLDEPIHAAKRYFELNADDVKNAFSRRVRPDDLVQVVRGPAPK